ncbi:acylphosphatase [Stakelama sediminis]|uniref:acylphosphatase n=1 Tax=Stakelama sediminis TaxID=463200 RepID=A0A840YYP5_9SPHN|nr:acylphosphatase [Stakelama sediminis]MBB5718667.1 acylphosphatase [Stakelama sediminis]
MITRRITVTGRVQGVFFRNWTVQAARELEITGWVRNRRDGSVEILATAAEEKLNDLIQKCRTGPPRSQVESVKYEDVVCERFDMFSRRPTV